MAVDYLQKKRSDTFSSIPIGSISSLDSKVRDQYIVAFHNLPPSLFHLGSSAKSGAFIRGVLKSYKVQTEQAGRHVAFAVLQILLREKTLAQLPATLSSELKISNEKAQAISNEIEKELIAPIAKDLNEYLASKKQQGSDKQQSQRGGMNNVLDLKDGPKPPQPPSPDHRS